VDFFLETDPLPESDGNQFAAKNRDLYSAHRYFRRIEAIAGTEAQIGDRANPDGLSSVRNTVGLHCLIFVRLKTYPGDFLAA